MVKKEPTTLIERLGFKDESLSTPEHSLFPLRMWRRRGLRRFFAVKARRLMR